MPFDPSVDCRFDQLGRIEALRDLDIDFRELKKKGACNLCEEPPLPMTIRECPIYFGNTEQMSPRDHIIILTHFYLASSAPVKGNLTNRRTPPPLAWAWAI